MELPEHLKYSESHEWVLEHGDGTASIGITALAAEQLGELVYVELPKPGAQLKKGDACAVVESTKAASDVYTPLSGEITEVNGALAQAPAQVNEAPYAGGWLFKVKIAAPAELGALLDVAAYRRAAESAGHG